MPAPAALVAQWEALHSTAATLGKLAQIAPESATPPFGPLVEAALPWQLTLAAQGLDDIADPAAVQAARVKVLVLVRTSKTAPVMGSLQRRTCCLQLLYCCHAAVLLPCMPYYASAGAHI